MNKQSTTRTIVVLSLTFAFALSGFAAFAVNQAEAEITPFPSREKVISVTGVATTSVEPDLLVVTFGVETQEKTASEALSSNSATMTSIVDAVRSIGIADDELSTSRINIYPVYESYKELVTDRYKQELVGYEVTNTLTVRTIHLGMAADIIDGAVSVGANRVDNVSFILSPQKQLDVRDELLGEAILNAKKKAENALEPLDHKIIGVKAVSLSEFGMPPPMPVYHEAKAFADAGSFEFSTPVFSSDQEITTSASVIFLIGSN